MRLLRLLAIGLTGLALAGCFWQSDNGALQGYVEGDFLDVGAEETGKLVALDVQRGDTVEAGAVLFRIDDSDAQAARTEAVARVAQAEADLENLKTGERPEEIDVLKAQRDRTMASLAVAKRNFDRLTTLNQQKFASDADTDAARQTYEVLQAELASMDAQIEVANLASRPNVIVAAEHAVDVAKAAVGQIDARIARLTGSAPMAGSVQDTYFEPGEVVPAGRPVVSVLPPQNLKIRFFVPEAELAQVKLGDTVDVSCDSCAGAIPAKVTFISESAEFTPPVIYSVHARQKLVYLVEAHPGDVAGLKVGQPVDVRLRP